MVRDAKPTHQIPARQERREPAVVRDVAVGFLVPRAADDAPAGVAGPEGAVVYSREVSEELQHGAGLRDSTREVDTVGGIHGVTILPFRLRQRGLSCQYSRVSVN